MTTQAEVLREISRQAETLSHFAWAALSAPTTNATDEIIKVLPVRAAELLRVITEDLPEVMK